MKRKLFLFISSFGWKKLIVLKQGSLTEGEGSVRLTSLY
jgi:hypothetical protein